MHIAIATLNTSNNYISGAIAAICVARSCIHMFDSERQACLVILIICLIVNEHSCHKVHAYMHDS